MNSYEAMAVREVNANESWIESTSEQFSLTRAESLAALGTLIERKIAKIDLICGKVILKDGRFWNREVLLRCALA